MTTLEDYARHSPYSDPGPYAALLDELPADVGDLTAVVRNAIVHYRTTGVAFDEAHLGEIDNRWVERILACDQSRFPGSLARPRPEEGRVAGCCRDFTLLTVAALRQQGIPARSRVGFATYFAKDFHDDHVVAEYWNGTRWVRVDAQLEPDGHREPRGHREPSGHREPDGQSGPGGHWPFDPADMPAPATGGPFLSAAEVWTGYRRGELDANRFGVRDLSLGLHGGWFVGNYVFHELAHLQREELLLWDVWSAMAAGPDDFDQGDHTLIDEVAALLLAADAGDGSAEQELTDRYAADPRLHPAGPVLCLSPSGHTTSVDLATRATSEDLATHVA